MTFSHKLVLQHITDAYGKDRIRPIGTVLKSDKKLQIDALNEDDEILSGLLKGSELDDTFADRLAKGAERLSIAGKAQLDSYVTTTKEGLNAAGKEWGKYYDTQKKKLEQSKTGFAQFKESIGSGLKSVGKNLLVMGVNMAALTLASLAMQGIATAIDNAVHASERAIEAAEKMKDGWNELDESQKKAEDTVAESGKRFFDLSKGVDSEGNNLSLTGEQYEEYISLSNELAGIFPTMVQGFNAQGDAILNTTSGLEGLNEQLKQLQRNTRSQKLDLLTKKDSETGKTGAEGMVARLFSGDKGSYTRLQELRKAQEVLSNSEAPETYLSEWRLDPLIEGQTSWETAVRLVEGFKDAYEYAYRLEATEAYNNNDEIVAAVAGLYNVLTDIGAGNYQFEGDNPLGGEEGNQWNKRWAAGQIAEAKAAVDRVIKEQTSKQQSLVDTDVKDFQEVARIVLDEAFDAGGDSYWGGGVLTGKNISDTLTSALYRTIGHLPAEMFAQVKNGEDLRSLLNDWVTEIQGNDSYRENLENLSEIQTKYSKGEATAGELQAAIDAMSGMMFEEGSLLGKYVADVVDTYRDARLESVRNALAKELGLQDKSGKITPDGEKLLATLTEKQVSGITEMMNDGTLEASTEGKTGEAGFKAITGEIDSVNAYNESISSLNDTYATFIENRKAVAELLSKDTLVPEDYDAAKEAGYEDAIQFNPLTGGYEMDYQRYRNLSGQKAERKIRKAQEARIASQEEYNKLLAETTELLAKEAKSETDIAQMKKNQTRLEELDAEMRQLKLMEASYKRMNSALQAWRDASSAGESGDEFREIKGAIDDLKTGLDEGRIGTNKFMAALELMFGKGAFAWDEATLRKNLGASLSEIEKFYKDNGNLDIDTLNSEWEKQGVLTSYHNDQGEKRYKFADDMTSVAKIAETLGQPEELVGYMIGALGEYVQGGAKALFGELTDGEQYFKDEDSALNANTGALEALTAAINNAAKEQADKADSDETSGIPNASDAIATPAQWNKQKNIYQARLDELSGLDVSDPTRSEKLTQLRSELEEIGDSLGSLDTSSLSEISSFIAQIDAALSETPEATSMADELKKKGGFATASAAQSGVAQWTMPLDADNSKANESIGETQKLAEAPATKPVAANTTAALQRVSALDAAIAKPVTKPVNLKINGAGAGMAMDVTGGSDGVAAADGTVNARGGTTLVGELGPEIIVDRKSGTWRIAKEPQLTGLNKGDIVFNARDTAKILARRGGAAQGKSFAYAVNADIAGGRGPRTKSSSSKKKILDPNWGDTNNATSKGKGKGGGGGSSGSGSSGSEKKIDEVFDWIQRALEVAKKATQKLIKEAAKKIGYIAKNQELDKALKANQNEINKNQAGYERYQAHLRSLEKEYGFGPDVVNRVKNGEIDLHKYNDDLRQQLEDYIRWHDLAEQCLDTIDELKEQEKELNLTKLDNIVEYYDQLIERQEASLELSSAERDYKVAAGKEVSANDYTADLKANDEKIRKLEEARDAYKKQFDNLVATGMLKTDSDEWHEYIANLEKLDQQLVEAKTDMAELNNEIAEIPIRNLQYALDRLDDAQQKLEGMQGFHDAQGVDNMASSYLDLIQNGMKQIANLEQQNAYLHEQQAGLDVLSERWQEIQQQIEGNEQSILGIKTSQEDWNDAIADLSIKRLQDEREELEKTNDVLQRKKDLQQAIEDLEKARSQRNKLVYREGVGFVYEADQDAIREAEDRLSELQHQELLNKIDDAIDAIEDNKKDDNVYDFTATDVIKNFDGISGEELYQRVRESLNLDALLADKVSTVEKSALVPNTPSSPVFQFGNIMLYGVESADELAQSIVNELPNRIVQKMYGR